MSLGFAAPAVRRFGGDFCEPLLLHRPFGYHQFLPAKPGIQWLPLWLRREFAPLCGLWDWLRARTLEERLAARALRRPLHPFFFCCAFFRWAFFRCFGFVCWFAHHFRAARAINLLCLPPSRALRDGGKTRNGPLLCSARGLSLAKE